VRLESLLTARDAVCKTTVQYLPPVELERISKPPFERLASNLRSVLIKEVISYGMYKEG
jgi:hypothetical protein